MNAKPEVKFTIAGDPAVVGQQVYLYGVKDHPRLGYQRWGVITSPVIAVRDCGHTIETMNTIYVQEE